MTDTLLWAGVVGAVLFVVVWAVEGALRPGYRPSYHPVSALGLGPRGWVQNANFVVCGLLYMAFGLGVHRATAALVGAVLLVFFGAVISLSGVFPMDPMRGYPPGTPPGDPAVHSRSHRAHDVAGVLVFSAVPASALTLLPLLSPPWRVYSTVSAVAGITMFFWFGHAFERDSRYAGAVQRALIVVNWSWLAALGFYLALRP